MLQAPEKYLSYVLLKAGIEKDISVLVKYFISSSVNNLHFIIDEKELDLSLILVKLCLELSHSNNTFNFKIGQRLARLKNPKLKYSKSALKAFLSPYIIKNIGPQIELEPNLTISNLHNWIPISNYKIERAGNLINRISSFQNTFKISKQSDYFNNEKLLIIGNRNLFISIPKEFPTCFSTEDENGNIEIEYNSPILPKICILKNINLLETYLQNEINGDQINFNTCIFVGSSKFEHSINIIRNYFNQRRFAKVIFIGDKDIKIDLGNSQIPLRWKWTIPEINYLKNKRNINYKTIIINNDELESSIVDFYQIVRGIENKYTISLKTIFRFIRRIYYDWNIKLETTFAKYNQIQVEFDVALKQLLIETLGNIFPDFNFYEYHELLSAKYVEIINAVKIINKTEKVRTHQSKIHQLIVPSFLCDANEKELDQIISQKGSKASAQGIKAIGKLENLKENNFNNLYENYFSLTGNRSKTDIVSFSKSDETNSRELKIISSIYGSGKIERLIERLALAKTEYTLLLYGIEEKAFKYHVEKYVEDLNREYSSTDRFVICGIPFSDDLYQYTDFDDLIKALATTKNEHRETEFYKIIFTDSSKLKLPSSKTVLKLVGNNKVLILTEDLSVDDKVIVYANPDKGTLRTVIELRHPELIKVADEYSSLWRKCLNEAFQSNIMSEPLYTQLVKNHFSVSEFTFRKYIDGEVMFPRSFSDLIIIAKTINDRRLSFEFLKNKMKPMIEEYRGKEIEYGFKFSNSINHFILTEEMDEFISEWWTKLEVDKIVNSIPTKTIKGIELVTIQNNNDE